MKTTAKTTVAIVFLGLITAPAGTAVAQTPPTTGDALRQSQPPAPPPQTPPALPQVGNAPIEAPMAALPAGPKVEVRSIGIVGNRVLDTSTLSGLVADGVGKTLSLPELEALALRITRYYRTHGYFVARAYVPAQEVVGGQITIRVVEGNYGRFVLNNRSLVRDSIVQGMLDNIKDADIVSLDTLERAMLIINDTPGAQVTRADVMPGQVVGTSDFAVDTAATAPYAGFVMLDNYGSAYTGRTRLSFNIDANSPTGRGDRLSLSGLGSETGNLLNGRIGYSAALAPNGLRGELAFSHTKYSLGSAYSSLDATGTARGFDAALTYPIRRIRAQTIQVSVDIGHRNLIDEIRATDTRIPKKITYANVGLLLRDERKLAGLDGLTLASVGLTAGTLSIKDDTARELDSEGARTDGRYNKLTASLSRQNLLPQNYSLLLEVRAQHALGHKNLDGSERMAISGSNAVMAYPPSELIGDDAWVARAELARPLHLIEALQSNWLVFTDYGQARSSTSEGGVPHRRISDAGVGFNANYRGALLRLSWAHRLESDAPVSEPYPRNKLLALAGWVF